MADVKALDALPSSCGGIYHVYLSFRDEDTGYTFSDHLYNALTQAGFRTFRGDDDLEMGENIMLQLRKAIQDSRISIIVFSKRYAYSSQCLDELVMILQRKKTSAHQVLPVFYDVDPSDVGKQMGSFEEAFLWQEQRLETEGERKHEWKRKVEGWKAALKEAADLAGMNFQTQDDGYESKFIQKIVEVVSGKLRCTNLKFASHPVGVESRVKSINMWLDDESIDVGILAICGMGGIGKTTIAHYVYNSKFSAFEGSSFLANIAEVSKQQNGIIFIQRQLLLDILKGREERINNVYEGTTKIRDALQCKKVLLVLDDLDDHYQFEAVLGLCDWLRAGSRIIITTRTEQLIKAHKFCTVHRLKILNFNESLELFSWHAFGQNHPNEKYEEISKKVVARCGGLPLAIKVLGSSLSGRTIDVWESQLKKLKTIPVKEIIAKLKTSYDSLDDHDKDIFLHIACFFVGRDEDYVVPILDGCGLHTKVGVQSLVDRCLLTICEYDVWKTERSYDVQKTERRKKLGMHHLLQEMGREIVRQESPKELGKRSRLWDSKDSLSILREKTGTAQIEGLVLNMQKSMMTSFGGNRKRRFQEFFDNLLLSNLGNSLKRRALGQSSCHLIGTTSSNSCCDVLEANAFAEMRNIKLLKLNYVHLSGSYENFPKGLKWLFWRGFPLETIPNDFLLDTLVVLEMTRSCLKNVWNGTKNLNCLKILDLSGSPRLTKTPNFLLATKLERLVLENCISLVEVHESIGLLEKLDLLNLRNCRSLSKLPRSLGRLKFLRTLDISGCSNLENLPTEMAHMKSLTVLHANGIANPKAQSRFVWNWNLKAEKGLGISWGSFSQSLVSLSLVGCNLSDEAFPSDLSNLISLQELDLSENPIVSLPNCIKGLTRIHTLKLQNCRSLRSITGLQELKLIITHCELLEKVSFQSYPSYDVFLRAFGCRNLYEIEGMYKLEPLRDVALEILNNLGLPIFEPMGQTNMTLVLTELTKFVRGKKFSSPQVCHSCYSCTPLKTEKNILNYNHTFTKQCQEYCVFRTYIYGGKVPSWFNFKEKGSSISFTVPPNCQSRVRGLTLCFCYVCFSGFENGFLNIFRIVIKNKTKGLELRNKAWSIAVQDTEEDEDITLLNYWKLENEELTAGDELDVLVDVASYLYLVAKEIGVRLLYEYGEQEEKSKQTNSQEEVDQQIFRHEEIYGIPEQVSADSAMELNYLHLQHEKPKMKLTSNGILANQQVTSGIGGVFRPRGCKTSGFGGSGYGGVIRDETGIWVVGYYGMITCGWNIIYGRRCTCKKDDYAVLYRKLRSICEGLRIICQRGWTQVEIEVDSLEVLYFLKGETIVGPLNELQKLLYFHRSHTRTTKGKYLEIWEIRKFISCLLKRCKCTLKHAPLNEWNQVAVELGNMAIDQKERFAVLEDPPMELRSERLSRD